MGEPPVRPWPVAPRPFAREALGSWLGRVAACYRMTVQQLILQHHLGIGLQDSNAGWLSLPSQPRQVLHRLASLARLDVHVLEQLQIPAAWAKRDCSVPYCHRCLVVNPLDVTTPYWHRCWLDPATRPCERHDEPMGRVPIAVLRRCRNFNDILHSIQLQRRRDASRPPYA